MIKALSKYVAIEPEKVKEVTTDKFVSVSTQPVVSNIGKVISAGDAVSSVKAGDRVAYKNHYAEQLDGLYIVEEGNIYAIYE